MRLIGEGTRVFRPVPAEPLAPDTVRLLCPEDYDPEVEDWEFAPGAIVRLQDRVIDSILRPVAVAEVNAFETP